MLHISRTIRALSVNHAFPGRIPFPWTQTIKEWTTPRPKEEFINMALVIDWIMDAAPQISEEGEIRECWLQFDNVSGATPGRRLFEAFKQGLVLEQEDVPPYTWQNLFGLLAYALSHQKMSQLIPWVGDEQKTKFDPSVLDMPTNPPGFDSNFDCTIETLYGIEAIGLGYATTAVSHLAGLEHKLTASLGASRRYARFQAKLEDAATFYESKRGPVSRMGAMELFANEYSIKPYKSVEGLNRALGIYLAKQQKEEP